MTKTVTPQWVKEHSSEINIIDIRTAKEFEKNSINGSKNIPFTSLIMNPEKFINKEDEYYIICTSGGWSGVAIEALEKKDILI